MLTTVFRKEKEAAIFYVYNLDLSISLLKFKLKRMQGICCGNLVILGWITIQPEGVVLLLMPSKQQENLTVVSLEYKSNRVISYNLYIFFPITRLSLFPFRLDQLVWCFNSSPINAKDRSNSKWPCTRWSFYYFNVVNQYFLSRTKCNHFYTFRDVQNKFEINKIT